MTTDNREEQVRVLREERDHARAIASDIQAPDDHRDYERSVADALDVAIAMMEAQPVAFVNRGTKRAHVVWVGNSESIVPDRAKLYLQGDNDGR